MPLRPPPSSAFPSPEQIIASYDEVPADLAADVGARLRLIRDLVAFPSGGIAQKRVAEALGMRSDAWAKYEQGKALANVRVMMRLCEFTGLTLDFIFRGRLEGIDPALALRLAQLAPDLVQTRPLGKPAIELGFDRVPPPRSGRKPPG